MTESLANAAPQAWLTTPREAGAIAIIHLHGPPNQLERALRALDIDRPPPSGGLRLEQFADIDHGLVARLEDDLVQLMPHGGIRVIERIMQLLGESGVDLIAPDDAQPRAMYPEAADEIEALMLAAIARAASPLAIDLLLDQPHRWRAFDGVWTDEDAQRSARLNRLIEPPTVVLAGPANVGKSTLSNALLGRAMSIELDMPGTTRDYTVGRIDLGGLVVTWHDTPGLRQSDDPIEQRSIEIAMQLIASADLLIAITDHTPGHSWPTLPREPDLCVANKSDLAPHARSDADLSISATSGDGIADLVTRVRDRLVSQADISNERPWLFDPRLR